VRKTSEDGSLSFFLSWEESENATFSVYSLLKPLQISYVCVFGAERYLPTHADVCICTDLHTSVWYVFLCQILPVTDCH